MDQRTWERARILMNYVDVLFEKMRLILYPRLEYDHGKEKIEILKRASIIRMAATSSAAKQMLAARAGYKTFVVVSYLLGQEEDFRESLRLLEDTAAQAVTGKSMPMRPRFTEDIFQE